MKAQQEGFRMSREMAGGKNGALERSDLKNTYDELRPSYEAALQGLHQGLAVVLEKNGCTASIKSRVKRFSAYYEKLHRVDRGIGSAADADLTDILGIRVICPFLEDVERIEGIICRSFDVVELEKKGARHSFREFGYDSVHLLVKLGRNLLGGLLPHTRRVCEIQIRTILQDAWAEVEHELIYKSDISLPNDSIKRKLASLNATLTLSDLIFQEIRDYQKEIRQKDRKRREILEATLAGVLGDGVLSSPSAEPFAEAAIASDFESLSGKARLEKAMVKALELHSSGELDKAILLYTQILKLKLSDPLRSLVYNHRGMAWFARAEYPRAIRDFSRAIDFSAGTNIRCYNNRALVYRVLKRYDRSMEDYDLSLAIQPTQFDACWGRAQTCYEMKLFSQSLSDCEKVLGIQPGFQPAQDLLKRISRQIF